METCDLEIVRVVEKPTTVIKLQLSLFEKIRTLCKKVPTDKTKFKEFIHKEIDGYYDDRILNLVWSKFLNEDDALVISSDDEVNIKCKKSKRSKTKTKKLNHKKNEFFKLNIEQAELLRRELLYEKLIELAKPVE